MITNRDEYLHEPSLEDANDRRKFADTISFGTITGTGADGRVVAVRPYLELHTLAGFALCGINVWDDIDDNHVKNLLVNYRIWAPLPFGNIDLVGMSFQNGSSLKMLDERGVFQYDFAEPERQTECHFTWTATSERIPWASGDRFDQLGRVEGSLVVRGEEIELNTLSVRTRGWYVKEDGSLYGVPGYERVVVIEDEANAFCACGVDTKTAYIGTNKPSWACPTVDAGKLSSSWILKDGAVLPVTGFTATVERGKNGWLPVAFTAEMTDAEGAVTALDGTSVVVTPESSTCSDTLNCAVFTGSVNGEPVTGFWEEGLTTDAMYRLRAAR